ncbi:MAG TPA: hypothetical protein ACFYD7_03905 [Candidatus Wujingus californicus]|uniref:hypothetical protein n=1 Tax=Candidatus Wujingus californicus TaxID=3367618 RepID=UPI001D335A72|nr:hypothetical protein [Planctomycetota bacterium]MDO8131560.1 hypothetical protein [Candidatus Brocadiales bacterium]
MSTGMWSLPISNKIFFTFFLFIITIAIGIGFLNYYERTGFSPHKTVRYYSGDEDEDATISASPEKNRARLEEGLFFPKSYRELLEVTHTHIFSIPIVVFILSRILAMTHTREGLKIIIYGVSFVGIILNLAAPWLIRYANHHFVVVFTISNIFLILSFGAYIFIPLYEMWLRKTHDSFVD